MNTALCSAATIVDCWNRIGVWGNEQPRCPKLQDAVHCRNCEVYSSSGRLILERTVTAEHLRESTEILARAKSTKRTHTMAVVVFRLGDEWMAIPTRLVHEITEMRYIHRVPHRSGNVILGLVNIRGELKICVSFGNLLGLEKGQGVDIRSRTFERLVVVGKDGEQFVFPVSEVQGTHRYHAHELQNVPSTLSQAKATYTRGILEVDGRHVACLDEELLLYALNRSLA